MPKNKNSLYILYNGKPVNMTIHQIFNFRKYPDILAATYSTSGKFLKTYFNGFHNIQLIVGLRSKRIIRCVNQALIQINQRKLLTSSNLFIPDHHRIHDKLYILFDDSGQDFRIITGSANLSFAAFSQRTPQNEEISIIDSPYAKPYRLKLACQHFNNLLSETTSFHGGVQNDSHPRLLSNKAIHQAMMEYHLGHYWQSIDIVTSIIINGLVYRNLSILAKSTRIEGLDCLQLKKYKIAHNFFKIAAQENLTNTGFKWYCRYDSYRCKWRNIISKISKSKLKTG